MQQADLEKLYSQGVRLSPQASDLFLSYEGGVDIASEIAKLEKFVVEKEDLEKIFSQDKVPAPFSAEVVRSSDFKPLAKEIEPKLKFYPERDITGKSRCVGSVDNFIGYFRDRLERFRYSFKLRNSKLTVINLSNLKEWEGKEARIVAMVKEKGTTKNGNLKIVLEDEWGTLNAIFTPRTPKALEKAKGLLLDEVVAVEGKVAGEFLWGNDIVWLDMPVSREQKRSERDVAILYLSDLHFGSRFFLEHNFAHMINWLKGNEDRRDLAGKIKYMIISGDIVDGVGVYPNQEKELVIQDIFKQYEAFDKFMEQVPDYIEIIVTPGNHDAVRRSDPQPALSKDFIKSNVRLLGSPTWLEIEGLKHLLYHGTSLDSLIAAIPGMSYNAPEHPMIETLKRRHLSPIYGEGGNTIVPEERDYMIIDDEPDVLHMGHVHKNAVAMYRGTVVINSGTFQARTDYQVRIGHIPTPCIATTYEPHIGKISHVDFSNPAK